VRDHCKQRVWRGFCPILPRATDSDANARSPRARLAIATGSTSQVPKTVPNCSGLSLAVSQRMTPDTAIRRIPIVIAARYSLNTNLDATTSLEVLMAKARCSSLLRYPDREFGGTDSKPGLITAVAAADAQLHQKRGHPWPSSMNWQIRRLWPAPSISCPRRRQTMSAPTAGPVVLLAGVACGLQTA
jgi:hypothetical protein